MKRLLLDTHVLLWWLADHPRLGPHTRAHLAEGGNQIYVSAVSGWEIGVNSNKGWAKPNPTSWRR
jgi:PIN domain nuclease of toxin-antitoxin system